MSKKVYSAEITFAGIPGQREPVAKLEDGREFPMGWNHNQIIPVGTTGTAKYVSTVSSGLWMFVVDKK